MSIMSLFNADNINYYYVGFFGITLGVHYCVSKYFNNSKNEKLIEENNILRKDNENLNNKVNELQSMNQTENIANVENTVNVKSTANVENTVNVKDTVNVENKIKNFYDISDHAEYKRIYKMYKHLNDTNDTTMIKTTNRMKELLDIAANDLVIDFLSWQKTDHTTIIYGLVTVTIGGGVYFVRSVIKRLKKKRGDLKGSSFVLSLSNLHDKIRNFFMP